MTKKFRFSFTVSAIMTVLMSAVIGIGLMMKYVLLSGTAQRERFGDNTRLYFLGMDRHEWGEIHLILGVILFFLVVIHIILHWNSVVCIFKQLVSSGPARYAVAAVFVLICILLIVLPLLIDPDRSEGVRHKGRNWGSDTLNVIP